MVWQKSALATWVASTGSTLLVVRRWGQVVEVWTRDGEQPSNRYRFADYIGYVASMAFAPNGRSYVTGSNDGTAILWDTPANIPLHTLLGHIGRVNSVAFAPDSKTVLTGGDDGMVMLWDIQSGACLRTFDAFLPCKTMSPG